MLAHYGKRQFDKMNIKVTKWNLVIQDTHILFFTRVAYFFLVKSRRLSWSWCCVGKSYGANMNEKDAHGMMLWASFAESEMCSEREKCAAVSNNSFCFSMEVVHESQKRNYMSYSAEKLNCLKSLHNTKLMTTFNCLVHIMLLGHRLYSH